MATLVQFWPAAAPGQEKGMAAAGHALGGEVDGRLAAAQAPEPDEAHQAGTQEQ